MNINIEFDILMFLANNPDFRTARDIVEIRKLKALIVFFPVLMKKHVRNFGGSKYHESES